MALSVITRPQGVVLGDCLTATINEDYAGKATVNTTTPHGLSDGDYVYVTSNVEDYNGFWPIDVVDGFHFFILQYPGGPSVPYIVDASITYCPEESTHTWNAVHLPIVYELESDTFPTNEVSTQRSVSSFSNENGYVNLNMSGSLGTFEDLAFIKITGTSALDGVYQILDKVSASDITINLAYNGSYSFAGGIVTLYFSNYHVLVEVWAGITAGHTWESLKPYEKAATLKLMPDSNNRVKFSISEILKSYITTVNNTLLASLPNNTDFWCNFYIKYAEAYDESNGYTITTVEEAMTSDLVNFEGAAANSELEFKNQYSGSLTQYLMTHAAAKFLTLFAVPVLFGCSEDTPDCYQDISFVKEGGSMILRKEFYLNDALQATEDETVPEDAGVFRVPIEAECAYDEVKLSLQTLVQPENGEFIGTLDPWTTDTVFGGGTEEFAYDGGSASVILDLSEVSKDLLVAYNTEANKTYTFHLTGTSSIGSQVLSLVARNSQTGYEFTDTETVSGAWTRDMFLTPTEACDQIYITARQLSANTVNFRVQDIVLINGYTKISETKTFSIDCGCSNEEMTLAWLNNLGGFDYWKFTAFKDHIREIKETGETRQNILPSWPKSYGSNATTIRKQTYRKSGKQFLVRSQHVTLDELEAIAFIKSSVLVQEVVSRSDRRTVIVDEDSFTEFKEDDKLYQISFTVSYTNDIPSQKV